MATFRNVILKKEDMKQLSAAYPNEIDAFLSALNQMFTQLHTMLAGGLVFGDNISAQLRTIAVSAQQKYPITVKHSLNRLPIGVIPVRVTDQTPQGGSKSGSGSKAAMTGLPNAGTQQSAAVSFTPQVESVNIDSFGALDPTHKYSIDVLII